MTSDERIHPPSLQEQKDCYCLLYEYLTPGMGYIYIGTTSNGSRGHRAVYIPGTWYAVSDRSASMRVLWVVEGSK